MLQEQVEVEQQEQRESDLYEHIKNDALQHDAQTTDAATEEQARACSQEDHDMEVDEESDDDVTMKPDDRGDVSFNLRWISSL